MTDPDRPPLLDVDPAPDPPDDPGFVTRRAVMTGPPAWGTADQAAHLAGTCDPAVCRHCNRGDTP
jgi:hypothetical protein